MISPLIWNQTGIAQIELGLKWIRSLSSYFLSFIYSLVILLEKRFVVTTLRCYKWREKPTWCTRVAYKGTRVVGCSMDGFNFKRMGSQCQIRCILKPLNLRPQITGLEWYDGFEIFHTCGTHSDLLIPPSHVLCGPRWAPQGCVQIACMCAPKKWSPAHLDSVRPSRPMLGNPPRDPPISEKGLMKRSWWVLPSYKIPSSSKYPNPLIHGLQI